MPMPGLDAILWEFAVGTGLRYATDLTVGVAVPELDEDEVLEEVPEARGSIEEVEIKLGARAGAGAGAGEVVG